jgi:hypothetical protein
MAGRDAKKLELIKQNLVKINPDCEVGLNWERSTASHSIQSYSRLPTAERPCCTFCARPPPLGGCICT